MSPEVKGVKHTLSREGDFYVIYGIWQTSATLGGYFDYQVRSPFILNIFLFSQFVNLLAQAK